MVKKAILLLSAAAVLAGGSAKAQNQKVCGSDEVYNKAKATDPKVAYYEALLEQQIQRQLNGLDLKKFARATGATDDSVYDIPLVFHIIHDYGNEYISDNDVYAAVNDINRYYAKANADTVDIINPYKGLISGTQKAYIGKSHMVYHLATVDPDGNPTHGITRHRSYVAYDGGDQAKFDIWSPKNYVNIWIVRSMPGHSSAAAYAYQPAAAASNPYIDGVISLYDYVYAAAPSSNKTTLAHELGHVMNLAHPWGNTNDPEVACGDDAVDDTPPTKGHSPQGCSSGALYDRTCTETTVSVQKDTIQENYIPVADTFTNRGISFIAYDTFKLRSVTIYPRNNNDTFKIALMKGSVVVDTFRVISDITTSEAQVVPLNFTVLKDTVNPYSLVFLRNHFGAYHDSAFGTYPKTLANTVTIQSDVTAGRYNFFYNWKVVNGPDSAFIGKPVLAILPGILTAPGITFNNPTRIVINSVNFYSKDTVGAPYQIVLQKKQGAGSFNTISTYNGNVTATDNVNTASLGFSIPGSAMTDTFRLAFAVNPRAMRDTAANATYTSNVPGAIRIFNDKDANGNYNYFYSWNVNYGYFKMYSYNQMTALYMRETIINGKDTLVPAFNVADSARYHGVYLVDYPDTVNAQNIMDYTYCARMFTNGQIVRMRTALTSNIASRNTLYDSLNVVRTGILKSRPDLAPIADYALSRTSSLGEKIHADRGFGCADGSFTFQFNDASWNDTITAYNWTFSNGATVPTATTATVNNKFTQPGWVTVTHTVTGNNNGGVTGTITRTNQVYAADSTPMNPDGYYQDFNVGTTDKWPIFNYYNNSFKWEIVNGAGVYDNICIRYNNFDTRTGVSLNEVTGTPRGDYDDYFTPAFDLTASKYAANCNFTFMSAGAFRTNNPTDMRDTLEIWYSTDCGNNWKLMSSFGKFKIANNGTVSTPFVPAGLSDWTQQGVAIPTAAKTRKTFFRIRYRPGVFNFYGMYDSLMGSGNHFYMDRINISSNPLGVNETQLAKTGVSLAPNPTTSGTMVVLNGGTGTAMIQVTDIAGKVVYTAQQELNGSMAHIEIPGSSISVKGMYLVHVVTDNINRTEKLVVY